MKKLWIAAALTAGVVAANADVYEQLWDGASDGIASSGLNHNVGNTGAETADTMCLDDITVTGPGWLISEVTGYGVTSGPASGFSAGGILVFVSATGGAYSARLGQDDRNVSVLASGNAVFSGLAIALAPGTYRMGIYLDSNDAGNQWFWKSTNLAPPRGGSAVAHNPGAALTGSTDPVAITDFGLPQDLSFSITYQAVPEPATLLAIGAGLALLAARRRK